MMFGIWVPLEEDAGYPAPADAPIDPVEEDAGHTGTADDPSHPVEVDAGFAATAAAIRTLELVGERG